MNNPNPIQILLERLVTPGKQTSEGKNATLTTWMLFAVLLLQIILQWSGQKFDMPIVATLAALLAKSTLYGGARSKVKGEIAKMLGQVPELAAILREAAGPAAKPEPPASLQKILKQAQVLQPGGAPSPFKFAETPPDGPTPAGLAVLPVQPRPAPSPGKKRGRKPGNPPSV